MRVWLLCLLVTITLTAAQGQSQDPDLAAKRKEAFALLSQAQTANALPLFEDLAKASPGDYEILTGLANCLWVKATTSASPAEIPVLLERAKSLAEKAKQLGGNSTTLTALLETLSTGTTPHFSNNPDVAKAMRDGEAAFTRGDHAAALAAYQHALELDPKLYNAALFAGDVYFRLKDLDGAATWFGRAIHIDPARETAYRYWGDALMQAGKMDDARSKLIDALLAEPYTRNPWIGLNNWAKRNQKTLSPPEIKRPTPDDPPPTEDGSGRSAWAAYLHVREEWKAHLFQEKFSTETQYRHSLAEESAALTALVDAVAKKQMQHLDPQIAMIATLQTAGLLDAWILLNGADAGIRRDYPEYSAAHRDLLMKYLETFALTAN